MVTTEPGRGRMVWQQREPEQAGAGGATGGLGVAELWPSLGKGCKAENVFLGILRRSVPGMAQVRGLIDEERADSSPVSASAASVSGIRLGGRYGLTRRGCAGAGDLGAAAAAPALPAVPMTATTVLIWTVVPTLHFDLESTPAAGEGISASTLSVVKSRTAAHLVAPCRQASNHLVMVPLQNGLAHLRHDQWCARPLAARYSGHRGR